jgi:hypothetical protein
MRKIMAVLLTTVCIIGLLTSCSVKNNNAAIAFSFDDKGNYTGFSNLPTKYTVEDAKKDGYFVVQDLDVVANNEVWDNYVEAAAKGNNTGIRIVSFYTEDNNEPHFNDLFFDDGHYYLFDSSSENQEKQPYLYLLTLVGKSGNPLRDSGVIVLTNDNTLTFDNVRKSMISSSIDYIKSVSQYRLVMFQ